MRYVSWNVNGLRAVHKKGFLEWLYETSPDILGLQETKAVTRHDGEPSDLIQPNSARFSSGPLRAAFFIRCAVSATTFILETAIQPRKHTESHGRTTRCVLTSHHPEGGALRQKMCLIFPCLSVCFRGQLRFFGSLFTLSQNVRNHRN